MVLLKGRVPDALGIESRSESPGATWVLINSNICYYDLLRHMARPLWFVELLKKTFPRTRLIARMTRVPLIGAVIHRMLFQGDDIIYLPKDDVFRRSIPVGESLDVPVEMALPSQVVHHFIDSTSYHWIMNFCICRESSHCKDYPRDYGCLFLGEAVLGINPSLGRRVTREEAHEYIRKCDEAGLVHLIGRNKLDAVWLNVSPGEKLLTICNCCPCCCLWRVLPVIDRGIGRRVTRMPGVSVLVNGRCEGCGTCVRSNVCFVNAITLMNGRAQISDECRGCGRCVEVCPKGAIELRIDNKAYLNDSIKRIASVFKAD
ncbi:MAG: 4Fe-4S binding protein [Candidatus Thorarchaeota archaeon]